MSFEGERCYCNQLAAHKSGPICGWDDFGSRGLNEIKPKENNAKSRKQWAVKSRYGYETLEDRYKFFHHEEVGRYMEDYRNIFTVSNRAHKKPWKPNGLPYNLLRMAPPARSVVRSQQRETATVQPSSSAPEETVEGESKKTELDEITHVNDLTTAASSNVKLSSTEQSAIGQLRAAPPLGEAYSDGVDNSKDSVYDECEDDDSASDSRIPLVTQLNTFFLSRHGRRATHTSSNSSNNLFPHIHSTCEHTSQDLGDMTAASIINYKVPTAHEKRRPTSHPKLTIQRNMDNNQQAMFKPMFERQKMQMFPMRTKSINASNLNHYDQLHSTAQTINHKRFSALHLRRDSADDKGLPKSHILTAKTISSSKIGGQQRSKHEVLKGSESLVGSNHSSTNSLDGSSAKQQRKPHVLMNYEAKSLHPYLNSYSPVDRTFGRAELVDYSTAAVSDYRH